MSEEEEWTPTYCPNCAEDNIDYLGKVEKGYHIFRCRECDMAFAVKDVTGKVKVTIEVEE